MSRRPLYVPLFWLLILVLGVVGFYNTGDLHGGYRLQYAGVSTLPPSEFIFYAWYALYGTVAIVAAAVLVNMTRWPDRAASLASNRRAVVWGCAVFVLVAAIAVRMFVLMGEPVADDELTYRFIAQTLLSGHVSNSPPIDPTFLGNQFVIAGPSGWYGKYPIGHPLVLAAGEAVGLRGFVVPVIAAGCVLLCHSIGRRLFDDRVAALGCVLLALSPQFVMTGATELSQPTESLLMLAGIWCALRIESDSRLRWAVLGGLAWGAAVLVRPLPGALFVAAAGVAFAATVVRSDRAELRARLAQLAVAGLAAFAIAVLVIVVNKMQTGGAIDSGYAQLHGKSLPNLTTAHMGSSFGGALLRQSFWLLGVPLSLVFVAFARPRARTLFWGIILAEYAYRFLSPKTVVATTGPVYVLEIVPLLCLATADGMFRVTRLAARLDVANARRWIPAAVAAFAVASAIMFLPVQIRNIRDGAGARRMVERALDMEGVSESAVVFANRLVDPARMQTWAYHPENPRPDLSNRRLFLRLPQGQDGVASAKDLWIAEFPQRRAFVVDWNPETPFIYELKP